MVSTIVGLGIVLEIASAEPKRTNFAGGLAVSGYCGNNTQATTPPYLQNECS
jgi:hypothetical protein